MDCHCYFNVLHWCDWIFNFIILQPTFVLILRALQTFCLPKSRFYHWFCERCTSVSFSGLRFFVIDFVHLFPFSLDGSSGLLSSTLHAHIPPCPPPSNASQHLPCLRIQGLTRWHKSSSAQITQVSSDKERYAMDPMGMIASTYMGSSARSSSVLIIANGFNCSEAAFS